MADGLRFNGFNDFERFARDLKEAEKDLRRGVRRAIREAAKPLAVAVIERGAERAPHRGGLSERVKQAAPLVTINGVGVVLNMRNKSRTNLSALDRGYVRHPVFAHGDDRKAWTWVRQQTDTVDAFTDAFKELAAPTIAPELVKAINEALRRATEGL